MVSSSQQCGNTHATKQETNSECVIPECICVDSLSAQSANSKLRRLPRRVTTMESKKEGLFLSGLQRSSV